MFPCYIPFIIRGSTLWVLSVAHGARKPEYWINRKFSAVATHEKFPISATEDEGNLIFHFLLALTDKQG
jgi:hypothetical protein